MPRYWLVSNCFAHPDSPTTVTRIVRLEIASSADLHFRTNLSHGDASNNKKGLTTGEDTMSKKKLYMILFNDSVCLSNLWAIGNILVIYRPYVSSNFEEVLFGARVANGAFPIMNIQPASKDTIDHHLVHKPAPMLNDALVDPRTAPVYLQYGQVTGICVLSRSGASIINSSSSSYFRVKYNQHQHHLRIQHR